jgi:hypothetical protein
MTEDVGQGSRVGGLLVLQRKIWKDIGVAADSCDLRVSSSAAIMVLRPCL